MAGPTGSGTEKSTGGGEKPRARTTATCKDAEYTSSEEGAEDMSNDEEDAEDMSTDEEDTLSEEDDEDTSSEEHDEDMSNVFTVELNTLRCEICVHLLKSNVYTCKNGHTVCDKCCTSVDGKCSLCSEPIGYSRCRAMEKILAGMTQPCKFRNNGCTQTVKIGKMIGHEEVCGYSPYWCLFLSCNFVSDNLHGHVLEKHATATSTIDSRGLAQATMGKGGTLDKIGSVRAFLHPDGETVYFLVNDDDVLTGLSLSVAVVYPRSEQAKRVDKCAITVPRDAMPGSMSLSGTVDVQFVSWKVVLEPELSLFVPNALCGDTGSFTVNLRFYSSDSIV